MENDQDAKIEVARAIAAALSEEESFDDWLAQKPRADYGAAPADGADPAQIMMIMEMAGACLTYAQNHIPDFVSAAASAFALYDRMKPTAKAKSDFSKEELQQAIEKALPVAKELVDKDAGDKPKDS